MYVHMLLFKLVPHTLLKISFTSITYDWFHKRYLKLVPQTLLKYWFHKRYSKLFPQTLLMIGSTNVTHVSVRMLLCMYIRCCSNWFQKRYSKLGVDPHTLLKISFTSVIQNRSTNVTKN